MIGFLKKLLGDRRGNALVIAGAALPVLVGAAGLATDTIQWALWKRELQRAADSAAFAGVYAIAMGDSANNAVTADLTLNNHTNITLQSGYPQVAFPTPAISSFTNAVQVTLAVQKKLGFSSLFLSSAPVITTTATAAMVDDGDFCVGAKQTTGTALTIGGNTTINLGCIAISNSKACPAVAANGSSYTFNAPAVEAAGCLPSAITGVATLKPHHLPFIDPYAGKFSTDIPTGMSCNNFNTHRTNLGTGSSPNYHLSPGCYSSFNPNGNDTYTLDPGVYFLDSTNFALNGNDILVGTGVTIILTGATPGSLQINGTSTVQLSAPTASNCGSYGSPAVNTCNYKNMLFIQAANAALNNNNTVNGTNGSSYDGAMYFPSGQVSFTGTSGNITKCAMVVANTVAFSGNTNLQNNTTGCTAATTFKGKAIRLIA